MAEREHITLELERVLLEAADLHSKSMDVTKRLRKAMLQSFPSRMIPGSIDPGYLDTRHREFFKSLLDGTQAVSLVSEAVKQHNTINTMRKKRGKSQEVAA